ncbi:MAG: DUF2141 domain-containing protein [Gammaproteobacteria bacterium]|nr:DUF2141 domain-containing protein [Gammaproteobacteria bacterium]
MTRKLALLAMLLAGNAFADTTLTIEIANISNTDGQVVVTAYASKKAWLKKPFSSKSIELTDQHADGMAVVCMDLPPGDYAIHVYHDLDMNGKMKSNFIGIPKEPTGVSNDAKGKFGPPKFKDAAVSVGAEALSIPVNLTKI